MHLYFFSVPQHPQYGLFSTPQIASFRPILRVTDQSEFMMNSGAS